MEILRSNLDSIFVLLIFAGLAIRALRRDKETALRNMLLYLVTEAEVTFGDGTGEIKYAAVVTWAHERLPTFFKMLFTEKQIDKMIEDAVRNLTQYLEGNPELQAIIDEKESDVI